MGSIFCCVVTQDFVAIKPGAIGKGKEKRKGVSIVAHKY